MPLRMFTDTLATLRFGAVNEELSKAMAEAVLAASTNGGKAEVVLKLQIKAGKAGQIEIGDQVLVKLPKAERGTTLMFATPEGNLQRNDPRQPDLTGLREVPAPSQPKEVKNG